MLSSDATISRTTENSLNLSPREDTNFFSPKLIFISFLSSTPPLIAVIFILIYKFTTIYTSDVRWQEKGGKEEIKVD